MHGVGARAQGAKDELDSREQESARRWMTEEGGEAEAVGG